MLVLQPATNHLIVFGNAAGEAFVLYEVSAAPVRVAVRVRDLLIVNETLVHQLRLALLTSHERERRGGDWQNVGGEKREEKKICEIWGNSDEENVRESTENHVKHKTNRRKTGKLMENSRL
jgi:hypothetical protein